MLCSLGDRCPVEPALSHLGEMTAVTRYDGSRCGLQSALYPRAGKLAFVRVMVRTLLCRSLRADELHVLDSASLWSQALAACTFVCTLPRPVARLAPSSKGWASARGGPWHCLLLAAALGAH